MAKPSSTTATPLLTFGLDRITPAVVAIDLHRGHLDPSVATMPVPPGVEEQVIAANALFNADCRAAGIPIVQLVTRYRDVREIRANPFWRHLAQSPTATRRNNERHNLMGSPGTEIIPALYDPTHDLVVDTKKRYDCFIGTDLDFVLRSRGINLLLVTGVNTNSCILATAIQACCRDYAVIVITDCVASMDGPEYHEAALRCLRPAFAWTMTGAEALAALAASGAWEDGSAATRPAPRLD